MALPSHPSLCYISTFEPYMPLIVFPPAQAYCSVPYSQRAMHRGDPLKCPKESHLCRLLSDLQSADREFVQNVWYVPPLKSRLNAPKDSWNPAAVSETAASRNRP